VTAEIPPRTSLPSAFRKEVVLAVDMNHAVLERALPLVTDTGYLDKGASQSRSKCLNLK
jgi:hypothetical protein